MQKLSTLLVAALSVGMLTAGCGSKSTTVTESSQSVAKPAPLSPEAVARAQASCKQKVQSQKSIPPSTKATLERICGGAAKIDPAAIRKATEEACLALLNASHVPAGAARERALAICHAP